MDVAALRERLSGVRWLGGGSGAGKSTTAASLAERYGLRVYATDDVMAEHARRCPEARCPHLHAFAAMSVDERWVHRSPRVMLETFHWFRGEGFHLIVEDLLALSGTDGAGGGRAGPGVLVEGFRLLPDLVAPLLADPGRALWLLPTPDFRRAAFESRGGSWRIAGRTGDPHRALANLLERDRLFTDELREQVRRRGLGAVEVDLSCTHEQLLREVALRLGL
ncbi:hypothetical protein [Kineococcus sp. SYSU DK005]|uniref:hypothetical protein n=1 Tax=Kineococcus sp. SYSU DK005 TaxID=3383126 RepID=UPI003D7CB9B0